jgi:CBS domain-containing protein
VTTLDYILTVPEITENSSPADCMEIMLSNSCSDLPVFQDHKLIGSILLKDCIGLEDADIKSKVIPGYASVYFNTHIMDILNLYNDTPFDSMAVLGEDFEYMGILTRKTLLRAFGSGLTVEQTGAVIIIEMATHQYSSSEISRIVESENAQILGLWLENIPDSARIRASVKINSKNAERIISSLMRFNYEVIASFGDDDYKENVEKRFQSLMKYLDI